MKVLNKRMLMLTSIVILLPMLIGFALWNQLPAQVPIHFDFRGTPDNYSSRLFAVVALPLFVLACHLLSLFATMHDPKKQNFSDKILNITVWICPVVSLYVAVIVYSNALGYPLNAARCGTILIGVLFTALGNYLPKCRQNYTVGIKLPWTLDDEDNWNHTHRFGGYVMSMVGLLVLIAGLVGFNIPSVLIIALLVASLSPIVYSFLYAKRHGKA